MTKSTRRRQHGTASARLALRLAAALAACALVAPGAASARDAAYVVALGDDAVWQYAADPGGLLAPLTPPTVATGAEPVSIAISPDGRSAYVTNGRSIAGARSTVSQYDVDPVTGALTPKTPATVAAGDGAFDIALSPDGRSAYVADVASAPGAEIRQYDVDPASGRLTPKSAPTAPAGAGAFSVAVAPDGRSVYVADAFASTVSQLTVDAATGALTPKSPPAVAAGDTPTGVAIAPDGRSLYVTNINSNTISEYTIDATGTLAPKSPATVATGGGPTNAVALTPDGRSLYVVDGGISADPAPGGTISQYDVDGATGVLAPKSPPTVPTATAGTQGGIAISTDGRTAYVTNSGVDEVAQYGIAPLTGALSPKQPPAVATGSLPASVAVAALVELPTRKEQCKDGGWRAFPRFRNQGDCVSFVSRQP